MPSSFPPEPAPAHYLVTGCAGMIGARLCHDLLAAGHCVVGVDNLCPAYDRQLKQWRLKQLQVHENFTFVAGDVCDARQMEDAIRVASSSSPLSAIFNLAARAGVRASAAAPADYTQTNLIGTLNLLEGCRQQGVPKFVLASSSSVYGADTLAPFREDAACDRPLSPYAASKRAAETLAFTYHHLHGIDVSVLRYFTVYGPAGRPDMGIFRFVRKALEGEPITIFGDGSQCRDFTYVEDITRGTIAAAQPLGYEIINLGGEQQVSMQQVLQILEQQIGEKPNVVYQASHPADVPVTWADVSKARQLLKWEPAIGLETGIARCVQWYQENRDFARSIALGE